jgi:hypothetical protein
MGSVANALALALPLYLLNCCLSRKDYSGVLT